MEERTAEWCYNFVMLPLRILHSFATLIWLALAGWCFVLAYRIHNENDVVPMGVMVFLGAQLAATAIRTHLKSAINPSTSARISN